MTKGFKTKAIEQIAPQLRALRLERKLKLSEIAQQTNLSINTIDNIELGTKVSFDKYHKLIRFYGKNLKFLL